jgi:hypothetical protein
LNWGHEAKARGQRFHEYRNECYKLHKMREIFIGSSRRINVLFYTSRTEIIIVVRRNRMI